MFGRRRIAAQGASTKARDRIEPFLKTFSAQSERFLDRARAAVASGDIESANYWTRQARRCVSNIQKINAAL